MTPVSLTSGDLSNTKLAPLDRAKQLAETLLSERGEASGALVARQLHEVLGALNASDRHGFQRFLATDFQPDRAALRTAAERYLVDGTVEFCRWDVEPARGRHDVVDRFGREPVAGRRSDVDAEIGR